MGKKEPSTRLGLKITFAVTRETNEDGYRTRTSSRTFVRCCLANTSVGISPNHQESPTYYADCLTASVSIANSPDGPAAKL